MKLLLFITTCAALLCAGWSHSVVAGVYRWVDETGQVHYSDTPHIGADVITIRRPNVSKSISTTENTRQTPTRELEQKDATVRYSKVVVTSPEAEASLWDIGGQLSAKITVEPKLQDGHGLVVFLDGKPVNQVPQSSTSFTITNVYRGTHTIRAAVYSKSGEVLLNGPAVTFFVRQHSVLRSGG